MLRTISFLHSESETLSVLIPSFYWPSQAELGLIAGQVLFTLPFKLFLQYSMTNSTF